METGPQPETRPEFDPGVIGDCNTPEPVDTIVTNAVQDLRGGIDGLFDTIDKFLAGEISGELFASACETTLTQIETARCELAGCDVQLPAADVNHATTTAGERLHELGRWVYQFFTEDYPWYSQKTAKLLDEQVL